MKNQIDYTRTVRARAMNKSPNQKGLYLTDEHWDNKKDVVSIMSVNAKDGNVTSHLWLQIPKENLQDVIDALKQFV
jgi:hypothetical protein